MGWGKGLGGEKGEETCWDVKTNKTEDVLRHFRVTNTIWSLFLFTIRA